MIAFWEIQLRNQLKKLRKCKIRNTAWEAICSEECNA